MLDILAYVLEAKNLKVGQRIIEARFNSRNERVEKSFEVMEVRVGRFVNFTIADEAGVSLRTYSPETVVEVAGEAFQGDAYGA